MGRASERVVLIVMFEACGVARWLVNRMKQTVRMCRGVLLGQSRLYSAAWVYCGCTRCGTSCCWTLLVGEEVEKWKHEIG